jgi:hypothetical protein
MTFSRLGETKRSNSLWAICTSWAAPNHCPNNDKAVVKLGQANRHFEAPLATPV